MGNLTRITKFKHFSGLTMTASNSLPNSTANRYKQAIKEEKHIDTFEQIEKNKRFEKIIM